MPVATALFTVNGITYNPPPQPIVVICIDGSADEYLDITAAHGRLPHLQQMSKTGFRGMVRGALHSFTNVNNSSPDILYIFKVTKLSFCKLN